MLQLETVDTHASVNYGAFVGVAMHGTLQCKYVDVVNFDHYNMIIATPFICSRKVILDFKNDSCGRTRSSTEKEEQQGGSGCLNKNERVGKRNGVGYTPCDESVWK